MSHVKNQVTIHLINLSANAKLYETHLSVYVTTITVNNSHELIVKQKR